MRYFFLSFAYGVGASGPGFSNMTCAFERYPTQKEAKQAFADVTPYAKDIVLMGITELTKQDYEILISER